MAYTHRGKRPVTLRADPIDPDSTEWVYFAYDHWLRDGETVTEHTAQVSGGTRATNSTYVGALTDSDGTAYTEVYGVQVTPSEGSSEVRITHRVSTETAGQVALNRTNIGHTAVIPVRSL